MEMLRPSKILRFVLRSILYTILTYLLLIVAWIALPSPSPEAAALEASYSATTLLSGRTLTRVYTPASAFSLTLPSHREGFALEYALHDAHNRPTLSISGLETPLLLAFPADTDRTTIPYQYINVTVRTGDLDGANLPWFHTADAVLLYWQIHRETVTVPVVATWSVDGEGKLQTEKLELKATRGAQKELLVLRLVRDGEEVQIGVEVPEKEVDGNEYQATSSSPSSTYPIRVLLIRIIAPSAIFINNHLGLILAVLAGDFALSAVVLFTVVLYGFLFTAIVVSVYRCLGIRNRRIDGLFEKMEGNRAMSGFVRICREGWHPERREMRRRDEEEEGRWLERGEDMGGGGGDGKGAKRVLDRLLRESRGRGVKGQ